MMKSKHFKRVENLIRLRVQLRRLTGDIERIEESIRLWKSTDKIDVYWDNFWVEYDKHELEFRIASLNADMKLIAALVWDLDSAWFDITGNIRNQSIEFRNNLILPRLARRRPGKKDIVGLQAVAKETLQTINWLLSSRWDKWRRKDCPMSQEAVKLVCGELLLLEGELNDHWLWLTAKIDRTYFKWRQGMRDDVVANAHDSDEPLSM